MKFRSGTHEQVCPIRPEIFEFLYCSEESVKTDLFDDPWTRPRKANQKSMNWTRPKIMFHLILLQIQKRFYFQKNIKKKLRHTRNIFIKNQTSLLRVRQSSPGIDGPLASLTGLRPPISKSHVVQKPFTMPHRLCPILWECLEFTYVDVKIYICCIRLRKLIFFEGSKCFNYYNFNR